MLIAGCGPLDGTREVLVIAVGPDGGYGLHGRDVTADDLHALRGELIEFLAKPTVNVDIDGNATIEGGETLDVEYADQGGQLVALDHEGLIAVSAYHHLTQAGDYFRGIGMDLDLGTLRTLYKPLTDYGGSVGPFEFHDNASYVPSINAFLLLEERWLDYVPLAANEGVMAHEFAHAVFQATAGSAGADWDRPSINMWRSINEGLADVHAVALTGDPSFAQASAGRFVINRDVSRQGAVLTDELLATAAVSESYNPYPIGTVFAAVFWDYRASLVELGFDPVDATRAMGELALASTAALRPRAGGFDLGELAQASAGQIAAGPERDAMCAALWSRAGLVMQGVAACP